MSFVTAIKAICWIGFVLLVPIHASESADREEKNNDGIRLAMEHDSLPFSDDVETSGSNENEDLQQSIDMMNYLIDELSRRERELGEVGEVRKKVVKRAKKQKKRGNNSATSGPTAAFVFVDDLTINDDLDRCLLDALPQRRRKRTKRTKATKTLKAVKAAKQARRQLAEELQQGEAQGFDYTATDELESFVKTFNDRDNQVSSDEDDDEVDDDNYDGDFDIEDLLYDEEDEVEFKEEFDDEEEIILEEDFAFILRDLQVDPADYDRDAINDCLRPYQNPVQKEIVCNPPTPAPTERSTTAPTPTPTDKTIFCPIRNPLPVCPDIPCTPGEQVQEPCELTNDPSCENCPCECEGEKGKGKGKGKGYGKGHHNHYAKGKGYHGKGYHYYGKGYGKGKSGKGSKGAKLKGAELKVGNLAKEHDALVVRFVRKGICTESRSPTSGPTPGPSSSPTPPPTPRPTQPPSQSPTERTQFTPRPTTPPPTISFPTCPDEDIPECDPDVDCDPGELVPGRDCPCRCGQGKGKGKGKGKGYHHKPTGKGKGYYYGKGKGKGYDYSKGSKGSKSARIKNIKGAKKAKVKKAAIVVVDETESSSFRTGDSGAAMLDPEEGAAAMLDPEEVMEETVARPRRRRRRKTIQDGRRDEEIEATILLRYLQQAYDEETDEGLSELAKDPNHVLSNL